MRPKIGSKIRFDFRKLKPYKPEIAVALTGAVLMLIGGIADAPAGNRGSASENAGNSTSMSESYAGTDALSAADARGYARYYEYQIESLLESMEGISGVTAAVHVKSGESGIPAENVSCDDSVTEETDSQGGKRQERKAVSDKNAVIVKDASGNESVVYISRNAPEIAGIAVSVRGGASASAQEKIKLALMSLYDIPASKISITG